MNSIKKISQIFSISLFVILLAACGGESSTTSKAAAKPASATVSNPKATSNKNSTSKTAAKVVVSGEHVNTTSGGEFCIDVQVSNFVDIISMQYSTNWDSKVLEYKGVKNFVLKDLNKESFGRAPTEPNTLRLSWYPLDLQGVTLFDKATIYQVCFKTIGKSGTSTQVEFANQPMVAEIANSKMQKLEVDLKKVQINIK